MNVANISEYYESVKEHWLEWHIIECFLPDYYHRDEVLWSNVLERYIDGEEVDEEDLEWLPKSKEEAQKELDKLDQELLEESLNVLFGLIDWDAYKEDLKITISNERIWAMGSDGEAKETHSENIRRYTQELCDIAEKNYHAVIAAYEYDIAPFIPYMKE